MKRVIWLSMVTMLAAVIAAQAAIAAAPRDAGAKMRGQFGRSAPSYSMRSGPSYRSYGTYGAPVIVRTEPAPEAVAETPSEERRFSYQPAENRWRYKWHNSHWWYWMPDNRWVYWYGNTWKPFDPNTYYGDYPRAGQPRARTALRGSEQGRRSFSYEPSFTPAPSYRAPARMPARGGWNRDAGSKMRGNYGR